MATVPYPSASHANLPPPAVTPPQPAATQVRPRRGYLRRCGALLGNCFELLIGGLGLVLGLSILATLPVLQFISLGYLLESGRRVIQSGRLRDGFPGIRLAARLATIAIAAWLMLLPVRAVADLAYSAALLGNERQADRLQLVFFILFSGITLHFLSACWRGGRIRNFLWPAPLWLIRQLRSGTLWSRSRDHVLTTIERLHVPQLFWLGVRGFFVAAVWLVVPISIIVSGTRFNAEPAVLISLLGILLLALVLLYLPFLQLNFARSGKLSHGFDVGLVRNQFRRAPVAFWMALLATLVMAVPLYLLKAELLPREAAWLPSVVFVLSILPARMLAGWAIARAENRERKGHFIFRASARMMAIPVVLLYGGIVYLTQFLSWHGAWSLYEQHAFMLPVPFVGL